MVARFALPGCGTVLRSGAIAPPGSGIGWLRGGARRKDARPSSRRDRPPLRPTVAPDAVQTMPPQARSESARGGLGTSEKWLKHVGDRAGRGRIPVENGRKCGAARRGSFHICDQFRDGIAHIRPHPATFATFERKSGLCRDFPRPDGCQSGNSAVHGGSPPFRDGAPHSRHKPLVPTRHQSRPGPPHYPPRRRVAAPRAPNRTPGKPGSARPSLTAPAPSRDPPRPARKPACPALPDAVSDRALRV